MAVTRPANQYQRFIGTSPVSASHSIPSTIRAYEQTDSVHAPIVDAVPGGVVFICHLFDLPGVIGGIFPQKMMGQLVEGRDCSLAPAQVLEECL